MSAHPLFRYFHPLLHHFIITASMFRKHSKQVEKQLIDIVNSRNNCNKCGECGADYPTWASWNLGILLCGRCANIHKKVLSRGGPRGGPISKVKSLTLENWTDEQVDSLRRIGNKKAKRRWNPKLVRFPHTDDDDEGPIERFIIDKYVEGRFRDGAIDSDDYEDRMSRFSDDSGTLTPVARSSRLGSSVGFTGNRSRANSRQVPRLTHRKLTTFEQTQYQLQVAKIMGFGYKNRDAVLESLTLSNGDIDFALDILANDAKINPLLSELPPELPKRPSTVSTQSSAQGTTLPTSAGSSNDWWTGSTSAVAEQPQIYQYTDPVTGQVSYVDSNGQQYLDTNNPQHQQLLMQNTQMLTQQATKQNVLSLYNQPNNFTTNVATPTGQQQTQVMQGTQQNPQVQNPQQVQQNPQMQMQMQMPTMQTQVPQNQIMQQNTMQLQNQFQQMPQQVYMQPTVQQQTGFFTPQQQFQYGQPQQQWR